MLWRVRTTLDDRPGALARLAHECGLAELNILGLQIFPGLEHVTDEFVVRAPATWPAQRLASLFEAAGGNGVRVARASEAALVDQAVRYVQAARELVVDPARFPEVVARLFDAEVHPLDEGVAAGADVLEMPLGELTVQVRRSSPFTPTEHSRAAALAGLVCDVLAAAPARTGGGGPAAGEVRLRTAASGRRVTAEVSSPAGTQVVGHATLAPTEDPGILGLTLRVEPSWRRRGLGRRLLLAVAQAGHELGAAELLLRTQTDNTAVLPLVMGAGLSGRIRLSSDELVVRVPLSRVRTRAPV